MRDLINDVDYSSILLFVGTNLGRLATFKLLPEPNGGYGVTFVGSSALEDRVITIAPIDADLGDPAEATQSAVAGLREGRKVNGVVLVVTTLGVKMFRPPAAKGAHKTFDEVFCDSAAVVRYQAAGYALLGLFGDGTARIYSIPALKQLASANVSHILDVRRFAEAIVTPTGDIIGWTGPSEIALLNVWGTGSDLWVLYKMFHWKFVSLHSPVLDQSTSCLTSRLSSPLGQPFRMCSG